MFSNHTGRYIFDHAAKRLSVLDPLWRSKIVGLISDGAPNMTGKHKGMATFLEEASSSGLYLVWWAVHQLDLVVQQGVASFCESTFYSQLTALIGTLCRQQTSAMASKCPKMVDTRWLSLGKVAKWHVANCVTVWNYFDEKKPYRTARCPLVDRPSRC